GAMHKAALAQLEIARVFVKHGRKNGAGHEVLEGSVGRGRPKSFSVARRSLAVTGLTVFRLADTRLKAVPGNLHVIERGSRHHPEFLAGGEGRNVGAVF